MADADPQPSSRLGLAAAVSISLLLSAMILTASPLCSPVTTIGRQYAFLTVFIQALMWLRGDGRLRTVLISGLILALAVGLSFELTDRCNVGSHARSIATTFFE